MSNQQRRWPRVGTATAVVVAAGVLGAVQWGGERPPAEPPQPVAASRLIAYDSCATALSDFKRAGLDQVGPWGLDGDRHAVPVDGGSIEDGAAAPARPGAVAEKPAEVADHSGTNNHEADADEPDLVKTDGKRIVTVVDGTLRVVDTATRALTASLVIPDGTPTQLLLEGDRVLVGVEPGGGAKPVEPDFAGRSTALVQVDLAGGARVTGTLTVAGAYLDARQVGPVARVVVRSRPNLPFTHPSDLVGPAEALRRNREVVERSTLDQWLPGHRLTGARTGSGALVDCAAVSHPAGYTGTSLLTVLTFDLRADLGRGDPISVAADGDTVYATATSLYVADDRRARRGAPAPGARSDALPRPGRSAPQDTEVHQFDIAGPSRPRYLASGSVPGALLNQYSLSEHGGDLRIATTTEEPVPCCDRARGLASAVTVLRRTGGRLDAVGRVGGLGAGERIHSVRFLGDTAYVVTFRQTDPLYTVDLSSPTAPRVTGALKITGYSAYLHPVSDGLLLGVGQEATTRGRVTGAQVSLFDTTGPEARPVARFQLADASSEAEFDPHAFLYWADRGLVVVPVDQPDRAGGSEALVLRVSGATIAEVGRIAHPGGPRDTRIRRSLVAAGSLWTVSSAGVLATDLDSVARLAWIPFG